MPDGIGHLEEEFIFRYTYNAVELAVSYSFFFLASSGKSTQEAESYVAVAAV